MPKHEKAFFTIKNLFNSHIHLGGSLFEDVSSNRINLSDFIAFSDYWNELLKQKNLDKIAWNTAAKYSALLSKSMGVASVCTMLGSEILKETGLENSLIGYPVMNSKKLSKYLENLEDNYKAFRDNVISQNMKPGIFLHSLYANDELSLKIVSKLLNDFPEDFLQIHIAEDIETTNKVFDKYSQREIDVLEKYNLLSKNTMLVHCCLLTDSELKKVSKFGSSIIICPESNLRVGQTPLNPKRLNNANVKWFIATDGLGTGGTLNLRKQAKILKEVYTETSYDELLSSITSHPLDFVLPLTKCNLSNIPNSELAKFLIKNPDIDVYNKNTQSVKKELESIELELKKFKPTMKDFESWKKGEQND